MLEKKIIKSPQGQRMAINQAYRMNEATLMHKLCDEAAITEAQLGRVESEAGRLIELVRGKAKKRTGIDSFLVEYSLSSQEGIALMCLAEAFLRVPDKTTLDALIRDKLAAGNWTSHKGQSDSLFINAATWALILTGKIVHSEIKKQSLIRSLMQWGSRSSQGFIRLTIRQAMHFLSQQFVLGTTIEKALAQSKAAKGCRYSYDMLGEAALTAKDANAYFNAYQAAIKAIGQQKVADQEMTQSAGISIKLSALTPRYQESQSERVIQELVPILLDLAQLAKKYGISFTIDAEETERLDLSLDIIEQVFQDPSLAGWQGFGLAIQAYQKRAFYLLDWVWTLAKKQQRRMTVRLIKGAYWDSEIKKTQVLGLSDYPVFTHKSFSDVSFQACTKKLFGMTDWLYPQLATHNAYSVAMVLQLADGYRDFEFQRLYGMGEELYDQILSDYKIPCCVYAPVGSHESLLPYLVRRFLENGANSSFVHRILDRHIPSSQLIVSPIVQAAALLKQEGTPVPLPAKLFFPERANSKGFDFTDRAQRAELQNELLKLSQKQWKAGPMIPGRAVHSFENKVTSPQERSHVVGWVHQTPLEEVQKAVDQAVQIQVAWAGQSVEERAAQIVRFADLLEKNRTELMALVCFEAGKTWGDALSEVREAIDFCHYYASIAISCMAKPKVLQGYTGEKNELSLHPRGITLCISPWNFPLAIFTGQVVAALVSGNAVIAKPAEQTPLIAALAVQLMHQAGIPTAAVQLLPGPGELIGEALVNDQRIKAVLFTGSTQTARRINQILASRSGPIIPLIAETGGQNAMIVDSSALLEQVVLDVMTSAFGSAGQRCSALRVLFLQEEIYDKTIALLQGAMEELVIGDPRFLSTDIGPVIDDESLRRLKAHVEKMGEEHKILYTCRLNQALASGYFMPPTVIAIDHINRLKEEVFGPILHVVCFKRKSLAQVIEDINQMGYGLTVGIHSRIQETIDFIRERVHAGNGYVNRNMIGAVVGLQPFGGEGLSGTGPKAGGPHYLFRLCHERTFTIDTTASGGNVSLLSLSD